jgi:hypothetical protein
MRFRALSRDPFTDIEPTIPEFRSVGLPESEKSHGFSADKKNVREIDGEAARFLSSTPRNMSTCSPVIRPLMNNTARFSALTTRSILQLIAAFGSILLFP